MKKMLKQVLVLCMFLPTFALAKGTGTGEDQNEEQFMEILAEDEVDLGIEEIPVLANKVIVLDADCNILLEATLESVENDNLSGEEKLILLDSELLVENFGDKIYVSNLK